MSASTFKGISHDTQSVKAILQSVVLAAICFGCRDRCRETTGSRPDLNLLHKYFNQDLRFADRATREEVSLGLDRLREVKYWPAHLLDMKDAEGDTHTIYIEAPPVPEESPPTGLIGVTIVTCGEGHTPLSLRDQQIGGILEHARVSDGTGSAYLGQLLQLTIAMKTSVVTADYALSGTGGDMHIVLVRVERNMPGYAGQLAPYWFSERSRTVVFSDDWATLNAPSSLGDLIGTLYYMATVSLEENDRNRTAINRTVERLESSGELNKLLKHRHPWVREYAYALVWR